MSFPKQNDAAVLTNLRSRSAPLEASVAQSGVRVRLMRFDRLYPRGQCEKDTVMLDFSCGFGTGTELRHASGSNDLRPERSEGADFGSVQPIAPPWSELIAIADVPGKGLLRVRRLVRRTRAVLRALWDL